MSDIPLHAHPPSSLAELQDELYQLQAEFSQFYDIPPPCLPEGLLDEFYTLRQYKLDIYSEKCEIIMNMPDRNLTPSHPDFTLLPNTLPHGYTEGELMREIIKLEDKFYALYQFPPDNSTLEQIHHFHTLRNAKRCVLKGKYALLQEMTATDIPLTHTVHNALHTPCYNPSRHYHIYNGRLRPITYTHTHNAPPTSLRSAQSKWGGQRDILHDTNEPTLGDGRRKKS